MPIRNSDKHNREELTNGAVDLKERLKLDEPKMYRVLLLNDHYTPMDFVVQVLMDVFHKPAQEATMLMLDVHRKGRGVCGVYTLDIALTKIAQVHQLAKQRGFPLKCTYEEA
ncbi:MAG: ATP-dependent Clp protease adapter ClpS [Spirochaetes bacterium]|nr:ATP-dependent Clp protease adapter ClpS [Spirochaetota bacterium]